MSGLLYHGIPIRVSERAPVCADCGAGMMVIAPGVAKNQLAACWACGHQQPFPWPLESTEHDPHWWVRNL